MRTYRTILVTGCPRSGTTPVGANLGLAPRTRYLYEPFNPRHGLRTISRYYEVPGANGFSPESLDACVESIRHLRLDLRRYTGTGEHGWRRVVKRVIGSRAQVSYRLCRLDWRLETIIWKDPIACLTTAAVVDRHGLPVVVTVRPAAAVAASYKRMRWQPGVGAVLASLSQIGLDFPELRPWCERPADANPVIASALLWSVIYTTLLGWAESRPSIRFVSLQETIDRPLEVYRELYAELGLVWTRAVERGLRKQYDRKHAGPADRRRPLPPRAHVAHRGLDDVNTYGRDLLTPKERAIIAEMTGELEHRLSTACGERRVGNSAVL